MSDLDLNGLGDVLDHYVPELLTVLAPGLVVAIADHTGVVDVRAYGHRLLGDEAPMLADTVVRGGSMGKPLIAVAALLLAERGLLDLDAPVQSHVDDIDLTNPHGGEPMTARLLLTHRTGLRLDSYAATRHRPAPLGEFLAQTFASVRGHHYGGYSPLWAGRADDMRYSNLGLALMAHVVSVITARPYGEFVESEILRPLGMHDTWVGEPGTEPDRLTARKATGYYTWGEAFLPMPELYSAIWPASGLLTSMPDQARWLTALLTGGIDGHQLFADPDTFAELRSWQASANFPDPAVGCGLGLQISDDSNAGDYLVGHEGAYPSCGWGNAYIYPHQGIGVAAYATSWDVKDYVVPAGRRASALVSDLVRRWASGYRPDPASFVGLSEATSWATGVKVAERTVGLLGTEPFEPDEIAALAAAAQRRDGGPAELDVDAFSRGFQALNQPGRSGAEISAAIASLPVSAEMLGLAALAAGEHAAVFPGIVDPLAC